MIPELIPFVKIAAVGITAKMLEMALEKQEKNMAAYAVNKGSKAYMSIMTALVFINYIKFTKHTFFL